MRNLTWKVAIWSDHAQYRPGERLGLIAEVSGPPGHSADLQVTVTEGAAVAAHLHRAVQLGAEGQTRLTLEWDPLAGRAWTAYGAALRIPLRLCPLSEGHRGCRPPRRHAAPAPELRPVL